MHIHMSSSLSKGYSKCASARNVKGGREKDQYANPTVAKTGIKRLSRKQMTK